MAYTVQSWVNGTTPLDKSHMDYMEAGILNCVDADAVVSAASTLVANKLAGADTQNSFRILGDGKHDWGAGGATAPDVNLFRQGVGVLSTNGTFNVAGGVVANNALATQIAMWTDGRLYFGSASDTTLYRAGADNLKTDDSFTIGNSLVVGTADPNARIYFGAALDTNLYRAASTVLKTDSSFRVGGYLDVDFGGSGAQLRFGSGVDTVLYRSAAGVLKTDGTLRAGSELASSYGTPQQVLLADPGDYPGIFFGNTLGANLYSPAPGWLKTDGVLVCQSSPSFNPGLLVDGGGGGHLAHFKNDASHTQPVFLIGSTGALYWGPGGTSVVDTMLYRPAPTQLRTDGAFSASGVVCKPGTSGSLQGVVYNFEWNTNANCYIDSTFVGSIPPPSDSSLKKSIKPLPSTWNAVKTLNPVSFRWRDTGIFRDDGHRHVSFLADEVADLLPDGAQRPNEDQPFSLNLAALLATTVKALQEAMERIEALEAA